MKLSTKNIYYVYTHRHPKSDIVVYVGHGKGSRAWIFENPSRDFAHTAYLTSLLKEGFLPDDWVDITETGLTKEVACIKERELITAYNYPQFNKNQGERLLKLCSKTFQEAQELRDKGYSYAKIADRFQISTMTIYRALNKQTKALENLLVKN